MGNEFFDPNSCVEFFGHVFRVFLLNLLFGEPVVCTPESRGFGRFRDYIVFMKGDPHANHMFGKPYHPFQNHYTHKIIIFKLFRSLQLQFLLLTGINFRYSYSFVGLTGICLYSYSSVQLHKKMVFGIIFRKLQLQLRKEIHNV